jgi:hypothetical protein
MTELTIESVPSGAQVQIDGEIVGTTPLTYAIGEYDDLAEFRDECMSGGNVVCSWNVLKNRLEDQTVSLLWWLLTETERRSISKMAIENTLFYKLNYGRYGKPDCKGGEGDIRAIWCVVNGVIRTIKFGVYLSGGGSCYYRRYADSEEYCYVPEATYGLPCHIVSCGSHEPGDFGHSMCSIQVVDRLDSINNWIIFQESDFDIKPGQRQIPTYKYDLHIRFREMTSFSCGGYSATTIARFEHI